MDNTVLQDAVELNKSHRRRTRWQKIVIAMAAIVVFCTTYALILPAITKENILICTLEEHVHTGECYEKVEIPEETVISCGIEAHAHTDECWESETKCICGLEENEEHTHTDACYETTRKLICEKALHEHTEECYTVVAEAHTELKLVCTKQEHTHTDECFEQVTETETETQTEVQTEPQTEIEYFCGLEAHEHTEDCYLADGTLNCTLDEHTHTEECLVQPSAFSLDPEVLEEDQLVGANVGSASQFANLANGGTFTLTADITVSSTVKITKDTILDLNGHDINVTADPLFNVTGGTLTIRNSGTSNVTETIMQGVSTDSNTASYSMGAPLTLQNYKLTDSSVFSAWGDGALKNLFDNSPSTKMGGNMSGGTLSIEFETPSASTVHQYSLTSASDTANYSTRVPKSWILYGQRNGSWVQIDSVSSMPTDSSVEHKYSIDSPGSYQKYKIVFQTNSAFQMADIKLYPGAEESLTYFVTETEVVNSQTGATQETVKRYEVTSGGMIIGDGSGRAITMSGGTVNLESGYICNFSVASNSRTSEADILNSAGGAIRQTGGTINLRGAVIAGNSARDGGGIYVGQGATLNIESGYIAGNTATGNNSQYYGGGGVYIQKGVVNMSGGYVTNNMGTNPATPCRGGGAFMIRGGTLNLSGGYVTGNAAPGGGAIITYRINSADDGYAEGGKIYMTGGFITANHAYSKEGGGVSLDGYGYMSLTGGYITNNYNAGGAEDPNFFDWGGGGIFVSDHQALLYIERVLVTENTAGGFGGGIAGCSTGRVNICVNDVCGNFDNTAYGEHTSGSGNTKNEDHKYALDNDVFMNNGYQDYFCALSSIVSGGMLGGGTEMWTGSADGEAVTSIDRGDTLTAASMMGLTANPTEADKAAASAAARVFINGNESPTHGGGILANGYLAIGPHTIESYCRLELKATKNVLDLDGNKESIGNKVFTFYVVDEYGEIVSMGTNDSSGNISFDRRIPFTSEGLHTFYVYEDIADGMVKDYAKYKLEVDIELVDEILQVSNVERYEKHLYRFKNVKITEETAGTVVYNQSPGNDETHAVSLDPTGGKAFNNIDVDTVNYTVEKAWAPGSTTKPIQVQLYQNNTPYGDKVTLSSSNSWTYTWSGLPLTSGSRNYSYSVKEDDVAGYYATYETTRETASASYYVPATALTAGKKYIIVNSDGTRAMTASSSGIGRSSTLSQKTGTLKVNGTTYTKWFNASSISSSSVLTAESSTNGVKLKTSDGNYLRSTSSALQVSSTTDNFTVSGGSVKRYSSTRYIVYSSNAFTQSSSNSGTAVPYVLVGDDGVTEKTTITNTPITDIDFRLEIRKVSRENNRLVLPDARFSLLDSNGTALYFKLGSDGQYTPAAANTAGATTELITDTDGRIRLTGMESGTYTIHEVDPPRGFEAAADMTVTLDEETPDARLVVTIQDPEWRYLLPHTGGAGTLWYTFGGAALLMTGVVYGCSLRQKKKRRVGC